MTARTTVLVLGVGGNVSQGILKALPLATVPTRVLGACVTAEAAGLYLVEKSFVSPAARAPAFATWLTRVCREEAVQVVLSGVEPVLDVLAERQEQLFADTGARCIVSPPEILQVGRDKLDTAHWLERHGFPAPASAAASDEPGVRALVRDHGFPLVAKPRSGKGSQGVQELADEAALARIVGRADYVVQERLGSDDAEFTVGCFCGKDGTLAGSIALRRRLTHGTTSFAEAGDFPEVRAAAEAIALQLRPVGPINLQMRMHHGRPVTFELNIRYSGTTPMRARLGFNDVEAGLRHFVLGESLPVLRPATRGMVVRYWNEIYVDPEAHAALEARGVHDAGTRPAGHIETWGSGS